MAHRSALRFPSFSLAVTRYLMATSWSEPLPPPSVFGFPPVTQSIVKTADTALPELDFVWHDPESTPPFWPRHFAVAVGTLHALERLFQNIATLDRLALS